MKHEPQFSLTGFLTCWLWCFAFRFYRLLPDCWFTNNNLKTISNLFLLKDFPLLQTFWFLDLKTDCFNTMCLFKHHVLIRFWQWKLGLFSDTDFEPFTGLPFENRVYLQTLIWRSIVISLGQLGLYDTDCVFFSGKTGILLRHYDFKCEIWNLMLIHRLDINWLISVLSYNMYIIFSWFWKYYCLISLLDIKWNKWLYCYIIQVQHLFIHYIWDISVINYVGLCFIYQTSAWYKQN